MKDKFVINKIMNYQNVNLSNYNDNYRMSSNDNDIF